MKLKINGSSKKNKNKKNLFGVNGPFWTQIYSMSSKFQIHTKDVSKFCTRGT